MKEFDSGQCEQPVSTMKNHTLVTRTHVTCHWFWKLKKLSSYMKVH